MGGMRGKPSIGLKYDAIFISAEQSMIFPIEQARGCQPFCVDVPFHTFMMPLNTKYPWPDLGFWKSDRISSSDLYSGEEL